MYSYNQMYSYAVLPNQMYLYAVLPNQMYGREYDLDAYHIVAVKDFNMGAMENKGPLHIKVHCHKGAMENKGRTFNNSRGLTAELGSRAYQPSFTAELNIRA